MLRYLKSLALLFCLLLVGCITPQEFQQKHDHDTVVKFASRRLDNKRHSTEWAKVLESSFAQASETDLRKIEDLKTFGTTEAWEQIHAINEQILKRQKRVEPLMPIVSEDGYRPDLRLLPVNEMLAESRQMVIDRSLPEIEENLRFAENGQRLKARKAYARILFLKKKYDWDDLLAEELQYKALSLGRAYFLVDIESRWSFFDYTRVVDHLYFWGIGNNDQWQVVHLSPQRGVSYDFKAEIAILNAGVSSDNKRTNSTIYTQQIQVGTEEVKDTNGVVISSKPIYETATAIVEEVEAWKDASLTAHLSIFDIATGREVMSQRIWGSDSYRATSCSVSGDARAFTGCCSNGFILFPSDWSMMDNCADDLRFSLGHLLCQVDLKE